MPGAGLADRIVNFEALMPLAVHNIARMAERFGNLDDEQRDPDNVRCSAITPEELAAQVGYCIDQPAGVTISDITVRATGEDYAY